jgi:N6-L-threonylcarbamoyladenine synthase
VKILSIETSCDETALAIIDATGGLEYPSFIVLGNALFSQIDIHKEYGGVFPMIAKREHAKKLPVLLKNVCEQAGLFKKTETSYSEEVWKEIKEILSREDNLYTDFREKFENIEKPQIDVVSVTSGPGLAPALWVGISFATALGKLWDLPVIPANHMEGHIVSVMVENTDNRKVEFPSLALLISGGHTELVEMEGWGKYKILGQTRDDAVGEAFDKTARLLGLPYPGGPQISKLAEKARSENIPHTAKFPRPMIHSDDFDFSFAGLKTSVLYYLRDNFNEGSTLTEEAKADIAREFEYAARDVLREKTEKALQKTGAKTLIIAGGVIADKKLRETFKSLEEIYPGLVVKVPTLALSGDNALMIACATYIRVTLFPELLTTSQKIVAEGNLKLS